MAKHSLADAQFNLRNALINQDTALIDLSNARREYLLHGKPIPGIEGSAEALRYHALVAELETADTDVQVAKHSLTSAFAAEVFRGEKR
jgi:hypothetical protein